MVLWEITVGTAYFLGLKRTYRLALKLQRRLVRPNHPKIRHFLHRRTRGVFDAALTVHYNIQKRDIEVGRNLGNWILRWLDRIKPSAHIRGDIPRKPPTGNNVAKQIWKPSHSLVTPRPNSKLTDREFDGRLFPLSMNIRPKSFPTLTMMMRPSKPAIMNGYYRHIYSTPIIPNSNYGRSGFEGVFRKDIMQWMLQI